MHFQLIVALMLFVFLQNVHAQNNWDGDNPIGRFTNCNNWFADACPVTWNSTTDLNIQLKNNGSQTTMFLDYGGWRDINNLTYFATYTSSVTQFDADGPVFNENGLNFYGKIENYSPNLTQVFNLPFRGRNGSRIELNPINGGLTFNRTIFNSGNRNFEVYGPNSRKVTLNGYPEGNGSVGFYIKEYSIVEVNYNNVASLSGGFFVERGELWVESGGVIQGGIQVGNGNANVNKLYISNPSVATTVANTITIPANSTNATIGSLNTSNTHTYSGTINLNNNIINLDVVSATGTVNFTNTISGTGGIQKISPGLARLSASNSYTGTTTINAGTLQYGITNAIADNSNIILNGGRMSTGATTGFSDTVGTLQLTDNSTIALGSGNHILTFAASNAVAWTPGRTLTITGWTNSCTGAKVFVGNNKTGLTLSQLAQITFQGFGPGASISPIGELIPGNVVVTATGGTALGNYATLRSTFDAINASVHLGDINITILNDLNEGVLTAQLNQVAGVSSVLIQPGGCAARTITGATTAGNALVYLFGADNVTINGLNTNGNSLTISNTTASAVANTCTILFQNDATNNLITNCIVLGSANMGYSVAGGNIWFGSLSTLGGNDNNTVSNCDIGPAGSNLPSKAIYFSGTGGMMGTNDNIVINNNNIYDFFSSTGASNGIEMPVIGSSNVTITNNRFFQTAARTQTTGSIHTCIRLANTSGNNFVITGNRFGYASAAGTGTYTFTGVSAASAFNPIMLTVGTATASSVQVNTIAGITVNTPVAATVFNGILVTAGAVNIGTTNGNTIGRSDAPLTFNATAGLLAPSINGISVTAVAPVANSIQNNVIQAITTGGIATSGFNVNGISVNGTATYTVNNNTIGGFLPATAINLGTLGTTTAPSFFNGIVSSSTGSPLNIGASGLFNFIQNVVFNSSALTNAFFGISTNGANATTNVTFNSIRGIRFASATPTASTFTGIFNGGAITTSLTISNNTLGIAGTDMVTYTAACSGLMRAIANANGTATAALSILSNDIRGIVHSAAGTSTHTYIQNTAATLSQDISSNTFTNLNVNTTGIVTFIQNQVSLTATGTKNINNNSISGNFTRGGASGNVYLYFDDQLSPAGATINNNNHNFSNITLSGTTIMNGWVNTDGSGSLPVKSINNNTFSNWNLGSGTATAINVTNHAAGSTISNNIISNINNTSAITAIFSGGSATISLNNISGLSSTGTGGAVLGISHSSASTRSISSNVINNLSSTGGVVTAIASTGGGVGTSATIDSNTISAISGTSALAAAIVSGISLTGGGAVAVTNNSVGTLSSANNGSFRGIFINPIGPTSTDISGNIVNGMTSSSTGTGFSVRGIEVQGLATGPTVTIANNTVSNISSPTTNVSSGLGSAIIGMLFSTTGPTANISGNTINGLNATAINVQVVALAVNSGTGTGSIFRNRIYNLTNSSTGSTNLVAGIFVTGASWQGYNNMISLINNNQVRTIGILDNNATSTRTYHHNSIYIAGAHAGTQISSCIEFTAASGRIFDIRNNLLDMRRTSPGGNYAIVNTGTTFSGFTSNYNVLNCTTAATIGRFNGTDQTFAGWKTVSGGDANSYTLVNVSYTDVTTADLHIASGCSDIESGGTPTFATDYDNTARNVTTPDIGADEFSGTRPADITLTPNSSICSGSSIVLNASSTDLTYVYTWTPGTGLSTTTGPTVTASPLVNTTYTVTGTTPSSCIKSIDVVISVNPVPAAIAVSPASASICPNVIQAFTASPNTGTATVGNFVGTLSIAGNSPYRQGTVTEVKIQYLFTRAELNAAGIAGGNITSIGFNVTTAQPALMPIYDIFMANTSATVLTSTYLTPAFTAVYSATNYAPTAGLNTHTFSTPFAWDGTSNIVIEIRHTGNSGTASTVQVSTPAVISTISRTGTGTFASPTGANNANRPITTFGFENPITWSPVTELFTDATATTVYNPLVHLNQPTIYARSSIARVYTATLTTVGTGCTRTSTGTILMNTSTWDGTAWSPATPTGNSSLNFTGNYTSSGNLSGCSCTVSGGNVVFNGPDALILNNELTVTAPGTIRFNNNSSLVQIDDTAINSGIITMERITPPIYRFDYTYWGSPVTLASNYTLGLPLPANGLSPDTLSDKFFSWTPTIANGPGNWFSESAATVMDPRKGYIVRGPQTYSFTSAGKMPYTANFVGTPNNGVISAPIFHGTLVAPDYRDDWNLLGNPYPSAVSAFSFLSNPLNTPIIDGTIYFWTHNSEISSSYLSPFYGTFLLNYNNSDYATWNRVGSVGTPAGTGGPTPTGFIAAGQGFFTKSTGTAPSGNTVTFNNSMRVVGNNSQFFRMASPPAAQQDSNSGDAIERQRIWLNLTNNSGAFNQILIGYVEGATIGWDRDFDGIRLTDQSSPTLYSIVADKRLVIQGRPFPFIETDEVPLGYRTNISGDNTFAIDRIDDAFLGQNIYLEDRLLNIIHNLSISPYNFASEVGTFNDRFVLRYLDAALDTGEFDFANQVTAFIFKHEFQVKSGNGLLAIELFDISGKSVKKWNTLKGESEFKTTLNLAQGVYLARIKLENGLEVTRKVVN